MPTLVTNIRQLRKRVPAIATEQTVEPEQIPVSFDRAERLSPLDVVLSRLEKINPALRELINTLDLEPVSVNLPPGHARLWELAGQSLEGNRTYTRAEAVDCISVRTSVTQDRAERGFTLMLESKAIEPTGDIPGGGYSTELFYLGGSTPY